jgi:hypothetical protein
MNFSRAVVLMLLAGTAVSAQSQKEPALTAPQGPVTSQSSVSPVHTPETPDLLRETQQGVREHDYVGMIWWIPFQYWEHESGAQAAENLKALKEYTLVGAFAGKLSSLGAIDFIPGDELRKKVVLRDEDGNEYAAISEISQDAKLLQGMLKPVFANAIGRAGENFELLFFPPKRKNGEPIVNPTSKGSFSVVMKDLVGVPQSVYQWRTPLTSLTPPKYCPVGKEQVNANWTYCPWHGVALTSDAPKAK